VEGLEELAVLLLGADHVHVVVELGTQQLQGLVAQRLGGGHHLAEVQHDLHQRRRVRPDLVGEVGERGTARQAHHLAGAARHLHAADGRRLHVVELLPALPLRLAALARLATGTAEGTRGAATATAATRTAAEAAATGTTAAARTRGREATAGTAGAAGTATAATGATATGTRPGGPGRRGPRRGHHRRARPRAARTRPGDTRTRTRD